MKVAESHALAVRLMDFDLVSWSHDANKTFHRFYTILFISHETCFLLSCPLSN